MDTCRELVCTLLNLNDIPLQLTFPPVSRHERYSLVRRQIGTPSVLSYVATFYKNAESVPSLQELRQRVALLVKVYPNLRCRVEHIPTNKPILQAMPFLEDTVFSRVIEKTIHSNKLESTAQAALTECLAWGSTFNPDTGDLWKIGRFINETNGEIAIVLSADHIIGDGKGTLMLLARLLSRADIPTYYASKLAPALEERVNVKPAFATLVKVIVQALLVPKLPVWAVPAFLKSKPYWPFDCPDVAKSSEHKSALQAEIGILVSGWTASQVGRVRSAIAKNASSTSIHTIISACVLAALWITEAGEVDGTSGRDTRVKLTTPTSERDQALGHPDMLGNYVGAFDTEMQLSSSSDFLQILAQYNEEMRARVASKSPSTSWGLLDYIDDPDTSSSQSGLNGWETFFLEKATSKEPFSGSIEVSNVGLAPMSEEGTRSHIKSIDWMQTPPAIGSAIAMNVVGCRGANSEDKQGDLKFSLTWRKDSVAGDRLSQVWVGNFKKVLEALPEVIAQRGENNLPLTLGALRQALEHE